MWESPNIKDHVEEYTDLSLNHFITASRYDNVKDKIGDYDYIYAGEYTELIIPDVSINELIEKINELIFIAEQKKFTPNADYQAPNLSFLRYDSITLYHIILFVNKIMTNANFHTNKLKDIFLLSQQQLHDLILKRSKKMPRTLRPVKTAQEYQILSDEIRRRSNETEQTITDWFNIKITNYNFTNIQNTNLYKLLETEFGVDYLKQLVTKLTKYRKRVELDV